MARERQKTWAEAAAAISVDVSGSTRGMVLECEISAIQNIVSTFERRSVDRILIGPWCDEVASVCSMDNLDANLESGGGTDPCCILQDTTHLSVVLRSDVWILMTDGEIPTACVRDFAQLIPLGGVHGIPCIIIVFGLRPPKPLDANISVGISVYSVVPHCMFLFQDVETEKVFILQTKGCFDQLNPGKRLGRALDGSTSWRDLSQVVYSDLARIVLPEARRVQQNQLILQDGSVIDMDKLYHNRLSETSTLKIIDSQDNLNAVLLTASMHGKRFEAQEWIELQQKYRELFSCSRSDVGGARFCIAKVIDGLQYRDGKWLSGSPADVPVANAHHRNWQALVELLHGKQSRDLDHAQVLRDARARLDVIDRDGPDSPSILSPVSPNSRAFLRSRSPFHPEDDMIENYRHEVAAFVPSSASSRRRGHQDTTRKLAVDQAKSASLFLPGYRKHPEHGMRNENFHAICVICRSATNCPTILLNAPPEDMVTDGFATMGSRCDILFPLALASFPETDIMSDIICCDECAVHTQGSRFPDTQVTTAGALPLLVDLDDDLNRETWLQTVDFALRKRFTEEILFDVILGIATSVHDCHAQLEQPDTQFLAILNQFCKTVAEQGGLRMADDATIPFNRILDRIEIELPLWVSLIAKTDLHDNPAVVQARAETNACVLITTLLEHPLESFSYVLRYTADPSSPILLSCLYIRIVLNIIENLITSSSDGQAELWASLSQLGEQSSINASHKMQSSIIRRLLSDECYDVLRCCTTLWKRIVSDCVPAIYVALLYCSQNLQLGAQTPSQILGVWLKDDAFKQLCLQTTVPQTLVIRSTAKKSWKSTSIAISTYAALGHRHDDG